MKIKSFIGSILFGLVISTSLNLSVSRPALAGFCWDIWNDNCDLIPDEVLPEPGDVLGEGLVDFKICNERGNGGEMVYYISGSEKHLTDGYCQTYTNWPLGTFISYDMWYIGGYQGMEYGLENGGNYYFTEIQGGIGFYKR